MFDPPLLHHLIPARSKKVHKPAHDASASGRALVDEERESDRLFATHTITGESLAQSLVRIAFLQALVRQAHLEAHLAQVKILTPEQNARYAGFRGYDARESCGHKHAR